MAVQILQRFDVTVQLIVIAVMMLLIGVIFVAIGGVFGYVVSAYRVKRQRDLICPPNTRGQRRYNRTLTLLQQARDQPQADDETVYSYIHIDLPLHEEVARGIGHDDDNPVWCESHRMQLAHVSDAVLWIRKNIGPCDDQGRLELIDLGEPTKLKINGRHHSTKSM